jgi:hypothetical protein
MAASSSLLLASSYSEAQRLMRANPGRSVSWDAGDGWTSLGYYCTRRRRCIVSSSNAKGGHF